MLHNRQQLVVQFGHLNPHAWLMLQLFHLLDNNYISDMDKQKDESGGEGKNR